MNEPQEKMHGENSERYLVTEGTPQMTREAFSMSVWMVLRPHSWELRANLKMEESLEVEIYDSNKKIWLLRKPGRKTRFTRF